MFEQEEQRDELLEKIEDLISRKRYAELRDLLLPLEAQDIAGLFMELDDKVPMVFRLLPKEQAAEVFSNLPPDTQQMIAVSLPDRELAGILDALTGEGIACAMERLLAAGALDVYTLPIGMKKSRPGVMLCVLCREEQREDMVHLLLRHTTTLGVRETRHRRYTLSRSQDTVDSPWGPVARKTSQGWGVRRQKPEYEDLARIAREQNLTLDQVRDRLK